MKRKLFVSVIIPCRNEERFIGKCLDSIIDNDYPKELLEVLIVDGISDDSTMGIVEKYADKYPYINSYENPRKIVPTALNIGIEKSRGEIIIRMDAHNIYEKNYISQCVQYLEEYGADNVGGLWITLPGNNSLLGNAIALAISHPFGVGNAHYRIGTKKPKYVDTVPFGCYRRDVFSRIGLFDEQLVRNQDDEFNLRLIKNGGKILLVPTIVSYYYARDSLKKIARMFYQYGYFKPLVARKIGSVLTWRQLIPSVFVSSLLFFGLLSLFFYGFRWIFYPLLALYGFLNVYFSLSVAIKTDFRHAFLLPLIFSTVHFSYGIGYLRGIWDFILMKRDKDSKLHNITITR